MRKTSFFAIFLVVCCTFITSAAQYLIKIGTANIVDIITLLNFAFIAGCVLYGLGALILIIALKYGELSVLYPFIALSFVWVFLISHFILHESILLVNWFGLVLIIFGVAFIGRGAKE